jgi:fatty acid desaturase
MISKGGDLETRGADPESWTDEAEQRDESSERESQVMRIKPDALKDLYTLDTLRSLAPVASTWALIFASVAIAVWSHSWAVWIVAAIIVGRSQHALAVLMHDGAHFRILENRTLNDFVGQWLCGFPIASNLYAYRKVHLRHHRYLLTDRDPDLSLSRGYPVTWPSFRRKLIRDATGVSSLVMRGYIDVENGRNKFTLQKLYSRISSEILLRRIAVAIFVVALFYLGYGWAFVALWIVPLLTVYQVILRIRGVLEHAAVPDAHDGLRNARTIVATNPILRFMLNPHHVAYHLEHHLFPAVPHYNLPGLHAALKTDPRFERALVEKSYGEAIHDVVKSEPVAA